MDQGRKAGAEAHGTTEDRRLQAEELYTIQRGMKHLRTSKTRQHKLIAKRYNEAHPDNVISYKTVERRFKEFPAELGIQPAIKE